MPKLQEPFLSFWMSSHHPPRYVKNSLTEQHENDTYHKLKEAIQKQALKSNERST